MKKILIGLAAVVILLSGCGAADDKKPDANKPDDGKPASTERPEKIDGYTLFTTPEGTSFYVPDGWKNEVFKFPPVTDPNIVMAGAEIVFYPPDTDITDIKGKLANGDFRYQELNLQGKTLLVYMQGVTNRFMPGACKDYPQVTFYENGDSDYKNYYIPYSKDENTEACSATLKPPALKYSGEASVYIAYGQRMPTSTQPLTQFCGIAVTSSSLSVSDREMFDKISASFRF